MASAESRRGNAAPTPFSAQALRREVLRRCGRDKGGGGVAVDAEAFRRLVRDLDIPGLDEPDLSVLSTALGEGSSGMVSMEKLVDFVANPPETPAARLQIDTWTQRQEELVGQIIAQQRLLDHRVKEVLAPREERPPNLVDSGRWSTRESAHWDTPHSPRREEERTLRPRDEERLLSGGVSSAREIALLRRELQKVEDELAIAQTQSRAQIAHPSPWLIQCGASTRDANRGDEDLWARRVRHMSLCIAGLRRGRDPRSGLAFPEASDDLCRTVSSPALGLLEHTPALLRAKRDAVAKAAFNAIDHNRDGVITRAEFNAALGPPRRSTPRRRTSPKRPPSPARTWQEGLRLSP